MYEESPIYDDFHVVFSEHGVVIKGFAHEFPIRAEDHPEVLSALKGPLRASIENRAFELHNATFCIWRAKDDDAWRVGPIDWKDKSHRDGSASLLGLFDGRPESYHDWAVDYFDEGDGLPRKFALDAIRRVYALEPLTQDLISAINPERKLDDMREELAKAEYPVAGK